MNLLIGAVTIGLILALLGLGVFVSYRIYRILDLTADGSFGLGAAVVAALLVRQATPPRRDRCRLVAGVLAGAVTGFLHTRFRVTPLLAGVLTSTALYSVSLFVMGSGNVSLVSADGFVSVAERLARRGSGNSEPSIMLFDTIVGGGSIAAFWSCRPRGRARRSSWRCSSTPKWDSRCGRRGTTRRWPALGHRRERMVVLGLGLSNGLVALSGALIAQYSGFANIQMGIGAIGHRVANLMVGETLLGRRSLGRWIAGAVVGAVVFRLVVGAAMRAGLNPNALKLVTASSSSPSSSCRG